MQDKKFFKKIIKIRLTFVLNGCIIITETRKHQINQEEMGMMNWKVIETCRASKFEESFEKEIAQFNTLVLAEDFIDLVIPKETKDRFRIEHI